MRILCNLPLECFEAREQFRDVELITFGPPDRMWVDGVFFPFDIAFDAAEGNLDELLARLHGGWRPDLILLYWPDQEPLPGGLENSPIPVVGVISDYNFSLPYLTGLWPFFDVLLVDRSGVDLFGRLSFSDVRRFCQFSFKQRFHRIHEGVDRDLDVGFCGNLSPVLHRDRGAWLHRLEGLSDQGLRIAVTSGIHGEAYGRFLNRTRIGFNRSIRGEMNLRAFEVPACGSLLFMEDSNLEVREFLTPGEEVVLYDQENFEELVREFLADEPRRQRMAQAGHRRIQQYSMGKRLAALADLLAVSGPGRPPAERFDCLLGRGVAMLATWARGPGTLRPLVEACDLRPEDPRPLNALALALLGSKGDEHVLHACRLLERACAVSRTYVPAAVNLLTLLESSDRGDLTASVRDGLEQRLAHRPSRQDLDGPVLGTWRRIVDVSTALGEAARSGTPVEVAAWAPRATVPV